MADRLGSNPALSQQESFGKRLRHIAVGPLFALVLLIPKILHARRNPRSWMLFRIFLGVAGVALVIVPLGSWSSYAPAFVGLTMFISAILLPSAKPSADAGEKTRVLGALVVVNVGRLQLCADFSFAAPLLFRSIPIPLRHITHQHFLTIPPH